jgi:hypothetical protein
LISVKPKTKSLNIFLRSHIPVMPLGIMFLYFIFSSSSSSSDSKTYTEHSTSSSNSDSDTTLISSQISDATVTSQSSRSIISRKKHNNNSKSMPQGRTRERRKPHQDALFLPNSAKGNWISTWQSLSQIKNWTKYLSVS